MGGTNFDLVAAAVLLDNPRITAEEFVQLLSKTRANEVQYVGEGKSWKGFASQRVRKHGRIHFSYFHCGLDGLAEIILNLDSSDEYQKEYVGVRDENGIIFCQPSIEPIISGKNYFKEKPISVRWNFENVVGESRVEEIISEKLEVDCDPMYYRLGPSVVDEILEEKELPFHPEETHLEYEYKIRIRPLERKFKTEGFRSIEALAEKYPEPTP